MDSTPSTTGTDMVVTMTMQLARLAERRTELIAKHEKQLAALDREAANLRERRAARAGGLDLAMIETAEQVMVVSYIGNRYRGEGRSVIADAINDLATGAKQLRDTYFGTKRYDRWDGQREDHEYGYGPRHGSIIFSVGLKDEARKRGLTLPQQEACVAYLVAIDQVAEAKAARAA